MKKIIYFLIGLVAVYLILCIVLSPSSKVERSITINTSAESLKSTVPDMKFFHDKWSPWTDLDPNMKVTYTGETGQAGSSMAWVSENKNVGKGSMTYMYTHGDTVMETLHFDDYGDSKVYHVITPTQEGASKITWTMQSEMPFLLKPMCLFFNADEMVGPDFEKGLNKLKTSIESMPVVVPTDTTQHAGAL